MKVVLTGGGTAGHVNPALSIANIIKKYENDSQFEYIGTKEHIESKRVPKAGYNINYIDVMGLKRSLSLQNIKALYMTLKAINICKKYLKDIKPDVVIGTGGYVCYPVCYAASSLGIPVALHESNAEPGFAVKMLKNKADVVFVNFKETSSFLKGGKCKVVHSGMPVDSLFTSLDIEKARFEIPLPEGIKYKIVSFGGSIGAKSLNDAVIDFAARYLPEHSDVYFIHAAGSRFYNSVLDSVKSIGLDKLQNFDLREYIYDMPLQMASSDIVICRSGAATVSEISALGKASILVPSPNVTNNQQFKNAKVLADADAALLINDSDLSGEMLAQFVDKIINDKSLQRTMETKSKEFFVKDTDSCIYNEIKNIIGTKNGKKNR